MAPTLPKKQPSDQSTTAPPTRHGATESSKVPLKGGSPFTSHRINKQRKGISAAQKQSLIDNLQLEGPPLSYQGIWHPMPTVGGAR